MLQVENNLLQLTDADACMARRSPERHGSVAPMDFLMATTLPVLPEATGIALAMAKTDIPYIISMGETDDWVESEIRCENSWRMLRDQP
jgi:hypothetical protein